MLCAQAERSVLAQRQKIDMFHLVKNIQCHYQISYHILCVNSAFSWLDPCVQTVHFLECQDVSFFINIFKSQKSAVTSKISLISKLSLQEWQMTFETFNVI